MKALHTVALLSIATVSSLHPMKQSHQLLTLKTKDAFTHYYSTNTRLNKEQIPKVKQFLDINNITSVGNVIAASATGNPLYLIPIIPQTFAATSNYLNSPETTTKTNILKENDKNKPCSIDFDAHCVITSLLLSLVMAPGLAVLTCPEDPTFMVLAANTFLTGNYILAIKNIFDSYDRINAASGHYYYKNVSE